MTDDIKMTWNQNHQSFTYQTSDEAYMVKWWFLFSSLQDTDPRLPVFLKDMLRFIGTYFLLCRTGVLFWK